MTGKMVPTSFYVTLTDLYWRGCLDRQTDSYLQGFLQVPWPAGVNLLTISACGSF